MSHIFFQFSRVPVPPSQSSWVQQGTSLFHNQLGETHERGRRNTGIEDLVFLSLWYSQEMSRLSHFPQLRWVSEGDRYQNCFCKLPFTCPELSSSFLFVSFALHLHPLWAHPLCFQPGIYTDNSQALVALFKPVSWASGTYTQLIRSGKSQPKWFFPPKLFSSLWFLLWPVVQPPPSIFSQPNTFRLFLSHENHQILQCVSPSEQGLCFVCSWIPSGRNNPSDNRHSIHICCMHEWPVAAFPYLLKEGVNAFL